MVELKLKPRPSHTWHSSSRSSTFHQMWLNTRTHAFQSIHIQICIIGSSKAVILVSWKAKRVYFSGTFTFPLSEISSEFSEHSFGSSFITFCGGFGFSEIQVIWRCWLSNIIVSESMVIKEGNFLWVCVWEREGERTPWR